MPATMTIKVRSGLALTVALLVALIVRGALKAPATSARRASAAPVEGVPSDSDHWDRDYWAAWAEAASH